MVQKTKKINKIIKELEITEIICNKCGKSFKPKNKQDFFWRDIVQSFAIEYQYGSEYDMEIWQFDICEDCLKDFIDSFKYNVKVTSPN